MANKRKFQGASVKQEPTYFLELKNISKKYGDTLIVKDISFTIKEGEILALLGPSGCGKSTLLNILNGNDAATSGEFFIRKEHIRGKNPYSITVFQRSSCFPWLTVLDNIKFALSYGFWKIKDKQEADRIAQDALKRVGLADYGGYYPAEISGGMQQRAALARTLVAGAPLILMDEPFVGLDEQTKELMHMLIMDLWQEHKKTMLVITHDLEEAIFIGDRIAVLSARPAEIRSIVPVDLPRPRKPEMKFLPEFIRLEKYISYLTEREVIKAAQIRVSDIDPFALKIGIFTWIGIAPFYIAQELSLFEKHGVDVTLVHLEKSDDRTAVLVDGEVDLVDMTLDRFLLDRMQIPTLQVAFTLNRSAGGDALLVRSEITNFAELKGKKIGIEKGWVNHFFLNYLLDKHNIDRKDVEIVDVKESDAGALMLQNRIDGTVIWEPWLSNIKRLSHAHILESTLRDPVLIDVLAGSKKIITQRRKDLIKLSDALFEATEFIAKNPDRSSEIVSTYLGMSVYETREQMDKIQFFSKEQNYSYLKAPKGHQPELMRIAQQLEEVWLKDPSFHYKRQEGEFLSNIA